MINFIIKIDKYRKYESRAFIWYQNFVAGVVICVKILSENLLETTLKNMNFGPACMQSLVGCSLGPACTLPLDLQTYIFLQAYSLYNKNL